MSRGKSLFLFPYPPLALVLILALWTSCSPSLDPLEVEHQIRTTQDSLFDYGRQWGEEFQIGFLTGDYRQLGPIREEMEEFLERSRRRLEGMKDRGGSGEYRRKFLEFLDYESELVSREFRAFETLHEESPDSLAAHYYGQLSQAMEKEQEYLREVQALGEEFRQRHSLPDRDLFAD